MKRVVLSIAVLVIFGGMLGAQQKGANISFEKEVHDFGKMKEDGGTVTYKFEYTNTGDAPLVITNVKASCGCTSPTWTQQPVMPGQKGFVSAEFDPRNRPGIFNKSIFVESNSVSKQRVVLRITGDVIPREKTVEDYYPKTIGGLRLESNHFAFVKVYNDQIKTDTLKIYNSSKSELKVQIKGAPAYLNLRPVPAVLKPGEKGYILGDFDGKKANDWGFITARVNLLINGNEEPNNYITISAKIEEDFSKLTKDELKNAPVIDFKEKIFDFGKTTSQKEIEHFFEFTNTGKSDLIIRKIRTTCGCTTVAPEKTVLKPGESSSFKTIFSPGSRKGVQRKSIYVITNDPKNPEVRLMINGEILADNQKADNAKGKFTEEMDE